MPKYMVTYSITHQAIEVTVDAPDFDPEAEGCYDPVTDISDKRFNHWLDLVHVGTDPTCPECAPELNVASVEWEVVNIEEVKDGDKE
jgi:hypothetical protein